MRMFSIIVLVINLIDSGSLRSQTSIQKVVGFALKYHAKCGEDFWDCIVQQCRTVCPVH
jgi:hypothetical protein